MPKGKPLLEKLNKDLITAAKKGHGDEVTKLLVMGAEIPKDTTDFNYIIQLTLSIQLRKDSEDISYVNPDTDQIYRRFAQALYKEEIVEPRFINQYGGILLDLAVEKGDSWVVGGILKTQKGRDLLSTRDDKGRTPLHLAVVQGNELVVKEILATKEGRDLLSIRDDKGRTPLRLAVDKGNELVMREILATEKGRDLLSTSDRDGQTLLRLAAKEGNELVVREVLATKEGRDLLSTLDHDGQTPLHLAAEQGKELVVREILATKEGRALLSTLGHDGQTPLRLAAKEGNELVMREILATKEGKDSLKVKDEHDGKTVLEWALEDRHVDAVVVREILATKEVRGLVTDDVLLEKALKSGSDGKVKAVLETRRCSEIIGGVVNKYVSERLDREGPLAEPLAESFKAVIISELSKYDDGRIALYYTPDSKGKLLFTQEEIRKYQQRSITDFIDAENALKALRKEKREVFSNLENKPNQIKEEISDINYNKEIAIANLEYQLAGISTNVRETFRLADDNIMRNTVRDFAKGVSKGRSLSEMEKEFDERLAEVEKNLQREKQLLFSTKRLNPELDLPRLYSGIASGRHNELEYIKANLKEQVVDDKQVKGMSDLEKTLIKHPKAFARMLDEFSRGKGQDGHGQAKSVDIEKLFKNLRTPQGVLGLIKCCETLNQRKESHFAPKDFFRKMGNSLASVFGLGLQDKPFKAALENAQEMASSRPTSKVSSKHKAKEAKEGDLLRKFSGKMQKNSASEAQTGIY